MAIILTGIFFFTFSRTKHYPKNDTHILWNKASDMDCLGNKYSLPMTSTKNVTLQIC